VSTLDHTLEPRASSVRRLEVITGTGRRRRFSDDDKARIIEETLVPGAIVSDVARRNGLSPQQLFTWRRESWSNIRLVAGSGFEPLTSRL
jgi:transposase